MKDKHLVGLFLVCLIFFAPFLVFPSTLSQKDNDLGRTYVPIYSFIKNSLYKDKTLPLWRPDQLMGESLIANPLSSLTYPANILFLILPTELAIVIYYFLHFFLAGVFTFYLARSLKLSRLSSLAAAIFYTFSVKMLLHLSAGHITMVAAFAYFPLVFLSIRKLLSKVEFMWIIFASTTLSFMLMLYPTIFYYVLIFLLVFLIYHLWIRRFDLSLKNLIILKVWPMILVITIVIGLSAIFLLPQIEFAKFTTRSQLKIEDVAIPLFNFKIFLVSLFIPYMDFDNLDHESFLYLGFIPTILFLSGFSKLSKVQKIFLLLVGFLTLSFIAGLSTPVFKLSYEILPFLKYSRVTTRLWFAVALVVALIAAKALEHLKSKKIVYFIILIFLLESFFIGYKKIAKIPDLNFKNVSIYKYLSQDPEIFRVYCTTYCFNPQLAQKYKIQMLNGETPIQDKLTVDFLQKSGNYHHDEFAVIFPPYQIWQNPNPPVPSANLLGKANVKYVASTYPLQSLDFTYISKFDTIHLYQNNKFLPRIYFQDSSNVEIEKISPNKIIVNFLPKNYQRQLIFSEKSFPGWTANIDGTNRKIDTYDDIFRQVIVPNSSNQVELVYNPKSFEIGKYLSLLTLLLLIFYFCYIQNKKIKWLKLPF